MQQEEAGGAKRREWPDRVNLFMARLTVQNRGSSRTDRGKARSRVDQLPDNARKAQLEGMIRCHGVMTS